MGSIYTEFERVRAKRIMENVHTAQVIPNSHRFLILTYLLSHLYNSDNAVSELLESNFIMSRREISLRECDACDACDGELAKKTRLQPWQIEMDCLEEIGRVKGVMDTLYWHLNNTTLEHPVVMQRARNIVETTYDFLHQSGPRRTHSWARTALQVSTCLLERANQDGHVNITGIDFSTVQSEASACRNLVLLAGRIAASDGAQGDSGVVLRVLHDYIRPYSVHKEAHDPAEGCAVLSLSLRKHARHAGPS